MTYEADVAAGMRRHHVLRLNGSAPLLLLAILAGCGAPSGPDTIHLVDRFKADMVEGRLPPAAAPPRTEWRFADAGTRFEAGPGVADLALRDGALAGRSTDDLPLVHLEQPARDDGDLVHAVEIRLRASAGTNLGVDFRPGDTLDLAQTATELRTAFPRLISPIVAGSETRTYVVRSLFPITAAEVRHVLVRPTDVAGATFAIESIRVIFEREYLAEIPSGLGWHGLAEIYRETLVARAPEAIRFRLALPAGPWLDLAIGTVEDVPVTFRIAAGDEVLVERTLTTPRRWEPLAVDLARAAGRSVDLSLSLVAEKSGAVGFWGAPVVRSAGASRKRPVQGVILIQADTLRRDHLDLYGYGRTTAPALAHLATEGARFDDCVAQATWTKVSTPSIMTGLYPASHGVREFGDVLPASATTLAEVFRDAGYATLSLSSVFFSGKLTNLQQGFEVLHESVSLPDPRSSKTAREYVDRLLPWLDAHRDVPFFVFLHVFDPHDPYEPHRPYDVLWGDASRREEHLRQVEAVRKVIADPLMRLFAMPTRGELVQAGFDPEAYVAQDEDWYDGSIRAMDVEIGRLVERLRALGLDRRTLLVFTSDHGEEFLDHGRMFHGQTVYGELTHVPLVLWAPGRVPPGSVVRETVESIDIMPTILELAGLSAPTAVQGQSLVPLLHGSGWTRRPAISEKAATSSSMLSPPPRPTESFAIVSDGWKLVHNSRRTDGAPEYELYDDRADPLNHTDVAAAKPEVVTRLAAELAAWHARAAAARLPADGEAPSALGAEELERLRSLGYVQ